MSAAVSRLGWRVASPASASTSGPAAAAELQWVLPKEVDWDRVGPGRLCNRIRVRMGLLHKDKLARVTRASLPGRRAAGAAGAAGGAAAELVPETHVLDDSDDLARGAPFLRGS